MPRRCRSPRRRRYRADERERPRMMRRRSILMFAFAIALAPFAVSAADAPATPAAAPTAAPSPTASETVFLKKIMADLPKRYPNPEAANKAGYVRYTNEDETGAISYANTKAWNTTDPQVPAQLWYDVKGRFIGPDYS